MRGKFPSKVSFLHLSRFRFFINIRLRQNTLIKPKVLNQLIKKVRLIPSRANIVLVRAFVFGVINWLQNVIACVIEVANNLINRQSSATLFAFNAHTPNLNNEANSGRNLRFDSSKRHVACNHTHIFKTRDSITWAVGVKRRKRAIVTSVHRL